MARSFAIQVSILGILRFPEDRSGKAPTTIVHLLEYIRTPLPFLYLSNFVILEFLAQSFFEFQLKHLSLGLL